MDISRIIFCTCVVAFTAVAAVLDVRTKRIPNALTVPALAAALVFHTINGGVSDGLMGAGKGLLLAVLGFATGFGILLILWLIGGGGGGDVKLMGALGAWLLPPDTFLVVLISTAIVVMGTLSFLVWQACRIGFRRTKKKYIDTAQRGADQDPRRKRRGESSMRRRLMPFGVPVALATWCVLALPSLMQMMSNR